MNSLPTISRKDSIEIIAQYEIEQAISVNIEHFAIPLIAGVSMDELSQEEYVKMGGVGNKPEPLSKEVKNEVYKRIENFIRPKIYEETAKAVRSVLKDSLKSFSDSELQDKAKALTERVVQVEPRWNTLSFLFENHLYLFEELKDKTDLKVDLISLHDKLCPIMCSYRDSGELFVKIHMNEFF
ncbi:MAG: hypothetical protein KDK72_06090 [Chlamydiia bacterium]|nr:hypothetical protein [Chlamydiia bacterium]